jgi:threonylcarbamoyladenosine tRNA methylthiotransferase MtaB
LASIRVSDMKIKISSLGCRLNQSEIQSVSTSLQDMGHQITQGDDADVFIINSCAVTLRSEAKTRRLIHHAMSFPGAKTIVTGCIAGPPARNGNIYYLPNDYKFMVPDLVADWDIFDTIEPPPDSRFKFAPPLKSSTSRVNLKIQDGCDNYCSYCIVPLMRGDPQSKPARQVVDEFSRLVDAGYKEIILTGVMIGKYNNGGLDLAGITGRLLNITGRFRVHLTSLTPIYVTPKLMELLAHDKMVKHLHLSMQSGNNEILKEMNRPYTREEYLSLVERIKRAIPDFNFTTDVIVGFPGETEEKFRDTLGLIRAVGFSHVHTFRYSPRPGTNAAEMEDSVAEKIKTDRSRRVIELYTNQKREYFERFNGRESVFLSERTRRGVTSGFNQYYAPIEIKEKLQRNTFFSVFTTLEPGKPVLTGVTR